MPAVLVKDQPDASALDNSTGDYHVTSRGKRRLRIDRSGPFFTVFLTHSGAMGLQIRLKLSSLGPILAIDAISPTGCEGSQLPRAQQFG